MRRNEWAGQGSGATSFKETMGRVACPWACWTGNKRRCSAAKEGSVLHVRRVKGSVGSACGVVVWWWWATVQCLGVRPSNRHRGVAPPGRSGEAANERPSEPVRSIRPVRGMREVFWVCVREPRNAHKPTAVCNVSAPANARCGKWCGVGVARVQNG